jgi:hypothetical protein
VSRRRSHARRQTGDDGRISTSPPVQLASDDDGHDAEPDGHPHRQQECEQRDSEDVFEGVQHVRVLVGVMRRSGPRRVPMASGPVATVELDKRGNRDTTRGPAAPIIQPAVVRPHSSQRKDRRPTSRLKLSSWPTIRQRNRVSPWPTVTWQTALPAVVSDRSIDVAALAHEWAISTPSASEEGHAMCQPLSHYPRNQEPRPASRQPQLTTTARRPATTNTRDQEGRTPPRQATPACRAPPPGRRVARRRRR